ncbi:Hypothetical protein, putative [Bodo saltans]|uniref:Reverse transcriptase domain-containing protein n=1 Tax=Bodo saltans TaxID=75058 RepID=A0A0S4J436_BODSA|nr:Hypothetical protein, putative [Bodo saltans]|eukprot:CUG73423.1 Hypothetical protein, putative [Bodo saltans]
MGFVQLFTSKEKHVYDPIPGRLRATRRRLITVPWALNQAEDVLAPTTLASRQEVVEGLSRDGASLFDIEAYYAHFPLPPDAQLYYCYKFQGKMYCLLTIPTGGRHCPALAQALARSIAIIVGRTSPTVQILAYLDNFRFAGGGLEVLKATNEFISLTTYLKIKISCDAEFSPHYTFLGIVCRHATVTLPASTQASEKSLEKLRINKAEMLGTDNTLTLRRGLKVLGSLIWIASITSIKMADHYIPLKFFRRKATSTALDTPISLWTCTIRPLDRWVEQSLENLPRIYNNPTVAPEATHLTLFASLDGYGSVAMAVNAANIPTLRICMGPWARMLGELTPHINQLEALALVLGIRDCSRFQADTADIFVDNSTLVHIVERGYSPRYWANTAAAVLNDLLNDQFNDWRITWISTFQNLADIASRTHTQVATQLTLPLPFSPRVES